MTTPAQLSAQLVDLMTRWNAQQDQFSDWLTGDPAGGPNGDGRYPLTNAEGVTANFLSLPALINQVTGPAASAANARDAAAASATLAQAAQNAAQVAQAAAEAARADTSATQSLVDVQRGDVSAKWSDVNFWHGNVSAKQVIVTQAEAATLGYRDEALAARDAAQGYASALDTGQFAPALHTHVIGDVSGLQSALDAKLNASGGSFAGNAATATALQTARTISLSGDVTGSVSFNGSSNVTINSTLAEDYVVDPASVDDDVLLKAGGAWTAASKITITDGGNF